MVKVNFDGRILEGKNIEKKIKDIANEMNFSDEDYETPININSQNDYSRTIKVIKNHFNF